MFSPMRIRKCGVALAGGAVLTGLLLPLAGVAEDAKTGKDAGAVVLKEDNYRVANFVVG